MLLHLLYILRQDLNAQIYAVHVNHGLSPNAESWAIHCRQVCQQLSVPIEVIKLDSKPAQKDSVEAWAREQRYAAIAGVLSTKQMLLTAHHQDDQAETLLLQLLRGSGPAGLAAMPTLTECNDAWHARPLLTMTRMQLHDYARQHQLQWIEDESNADTRFDRNFLRNEVMPLLKQRWPNLQQTLSRAANLQAEGLNLQNALAQIDFDCCYQAKDGTLDIAALKQLDEKRQKNVIRFWVRQHGLPIPDSRQLQHIITDVLSAKSDAMPCVAWHGAELRRYRESLYVAKPLPAHSERQIIEWSLSTPCALTLGELIATKQTGIGIKASLCSGDTVEVRFRVGGESIKPSGRGHHHELKKLFQESAIPPWLRDYVPLIYIQGKLAAVADYYVDEAFAATNDEPGWKIIWQLKDQL